MACWESSHSCKTGRPVQKLSGRPFGSLYSCLHLQNWKVHLCCLSYRAGRSMLGTAGTSSHLCEGGRPIKGKCRGENIYHSQSLETSTGDLDSNGLSSWVVPSLLGSLSVNVLASYAPPLTNFRILDPVPLRYGVCWSPPSWNDPLLPPQPLFIFIALRFSLRVWHTLVSSFPSLCFKYKLSINVKYIKAFTVYR